MKKILNIVALLLISTTGIAQTTTFDNTNIAYLSIGGGMTNCKYETGYKCAPNGSFVTDLGYIRMFNHGLGLGIGLRTTNMGSTVNFTKQFALQTGLLDAEGEYYDLSTAYTDVKEKHTLWYIDVPISLHYRYLFTEKWGLTATAGLSLMLSASTTYNTMSGRITNEAYYPVWNVTLHDIDGIYDSQDIILSSGKEPAYRKVGVALDLSAGIIFRLTPNLNMATGFAYSQTLTNILSNSPANSLVVQSLDERKAQSYNIHLKIGLEYCF